MREAAEALRLTAQDLNKLAYVITLSRNLLAAPIVTAQPRSKRLRMRLAVC